MPIAVIDLSIKLTDVIMIIAVFAGPFGAVIVTERMRLRKEKRDRQLHVFRTLMATRASTLSPTHVEALNLIDIEFDAKNRKERAIIAAWKLYHSHLGDHAYPEQAWPVRRAELLVDLLYEMAAFLHYDFDKAHIKNTSYYPKGYGEIEVEQHAIRKNVLKLIEGKSAMHIISHLSPDQFDRLTNLPGKEANKAPEPTPGSVTPRATEGASL